MNTAKFFSSGQESSTIFRSASHAKQLTSINKKVIKIDSILKNSFSLRKQLQNKNVIKKSQSSFQEREKNLEKTKLPKAEKGIKSVPTPSGGGIFGWIGNFINNVIFGFIAIRLIEHLPKLLSLVPIINNVMDGIIDWGGKLLEGLVTFIDWGYSAYDNTVKVFAKFGGEGAAKKFQDFMGKFQDVIQYSLIAGMLFSNLALSGGGSGGGVGDVVTDIVGEQLQRRVIEQGGRQIATRVATQAGTQVARTAGIGVGGATLIVAGVGLLASALGEGAFQLKKFSKKIEKDAFKKRDELKKNWKNTPTWNVLGKAWNVAQYGFFETFVVPGMRLTNWILNGLGITLDIVGAPFRYAVELIRWALMALNNDTKGMAEQKKNLGKFDARIRDGIREHFAGFLGPIFRVIGKKDWADKIEKQGSWGSLYGDKAVKDMYGYASGGSTRGGQYLSGSAKREIRPQKKLRRVVTKPAKLYQGRTAGGIDNIQKVFPEPENIKSPPGTPSQRKDETMNPYGFMSHSYYRFASVPFVGPILAMPLKVMMGDTIDAGYYTSVGQGFGGLMAKAYDEGAFSDDFPIQEFDFEKIVSKSVQQLATREITSVRSELMRQLGLEKIKIQSGEPSSDCPCPDGDGGGTVAFHGTPEEKALLDAISWAEGTFVSTDKEKGYRKMFGGDYFSAPPWVHPDRVVHSTRYSSAAAGRYQFLPGTWARASKAVGATDFSPISQDKAALYLAKMRGVTDSDLKREGLSNRLMAKLAPEWASFPTLSGGSYYGQPNKSPEKIREKYQQSLSGGSIAAINSINSQIASSSPAASVSDCSCDGDNTPDPTNLNLDDDKTTGDKSGKKIYLHWSASEDTLNRSIWVKEDGGYWAGYHRYILGNGQVVPNQHPGHASFGSRPPNHTWKRNTSTSAAFAVSGMAGASPSNFGRYPIKPIQYDTMASSVAKLAKSWGWSSSDITSNNVMTHYEAAINDGYSGERWDLGKLYQSDRMGTGPEKIRQMIKSKMGSAGKFGGGPINEGLTKVHPGEFIIDKDSVDVFGMEFMSIINQVENKSQLRRAKDSLIQILMEKVPYYSDMAPDKVIKVPPSGGGYAPNVAVLSGSISDVGSSDSCPWKDKLVCGNG